MGSVIEGYNYDIFISYRQKDNKYDGWVTEFVENLKKELEATFKEEISVYFDANPCDGLLETYEVDASLKEKLKCLIFIPVISRTYCDPKSYAWEHEFSAFVEEASKDQFGLTIKLLNGNVASRVLPVRIYELDDFDTRQCEALLGSFLRGVEFIYKEPGVNRPLRPNEENPHDNHCRTIYRNQLNKVANTIKELILAFAQQEHKIKTPEEKDIRPRYVNFKKYNRRILMTAAILLALTVSLLLLSRFFKPEESNEKSIAVLPFKLLSNEPDKQFLADGMMEAITFHLSKMSDVRVIARTSVEQYRQTTKTIGVIGKELNVEYLLEGSFQKFGDNTRLIVQLIKASDETHLWANEYNSKWIEVFSLQSDVAQKIASELKIVITPEELERMAEKPTENLDAYQAYLRGRYYLGQPHFSSSNWAMALKSFQEAVDIDTTFALAHAELARAHARLIFLRQDLSEERLEKAKQSAEKALRLGYNQPRVHLALGYYYLYAFRDDNQALKHLEIAERNLPNDFEILVEKASIIVVKGRWEEYIQLLEKARRISPDDASVLTDLTEAYWVTRRFRDAEDACNKAIELSPNSAWPYLYKAFLNWSWRGSGEESREALKAISPGNEWFLFSWYFQEIGDRNLEQALYLADTTKSWGVWNKMWSIPRATLLATIYEYQGKSKLALKYYRDAAEIMEEKVDEVPDDPRYHSALGIAYAGMGKKEEAKSEGIKAVNLLPISEDAMYGLGVLQDLAIIYTMAGDSDMAFETLEKLLSIPSWITPCWINWDIRFSPLKSHPEYKRLLEKYAFQNE